ncbi:MAG: NlpC/P60 family protein [Syntrophales bacterium]|nr:NlpC/P60 family protein [Syntrophales bacterium]
MMKRRIFLWMGLIVLFLSFGIYQEGLAKELYRVKRGDTLSKISKKLGVNTQALKEANNLKSDALRPNQILTIPEQAKRKKIAKCRTLPSIKTESYLVEKGDTLFSIAKKTGLSVKEIKRTNHLRTHHLKIGQMLVLSKPVIRMEGATKNAINDTREIAASEGEIEDDGEDVGEDDGREVGKDEEANTELLGKWSDFNERELFVRVVKGFLGAPYRFGGSSIRGIDCSAFVRKIYQFFGINLPRTAREQSYVGKRVPRNELEEGDLVFFNTRRPVGHVGIYIGNNKFIHASFRNREVRVDSLESPYFDKRFIRAVRVKGLDGEGEV